MSIKSRTNSKNKQRRREVYLKNKINKQNRSRNKINYDYKWRGIPESDHDVLIKEQFESNKEENNIWYEEYKRCIDIYMNIVEKLRKYLEENDCFEDMYDITLEKKVEQIWRQEKKEKYRKLCLHYRYPK